MEGPAVGVNGVSEMPNREPLRRILPGTRQPLPGTWRILGELDLGRDTLSTQIGFYKGFRVGRTKKEEIISLSMSMICSLILGTKLREVNAQPSIYPRNFLIQMENPPKDFSFDMYVYFRAVSNGLKENRIKVQAPIRTKGTSSWNTGMRAIFKMSLNTILAAIHMKRRY